MKFMMRTKKAYSIFAISVALSLALLMGISQVTADDRLSFVYETGIRPTGSLTFVDGVNKFYGMTSAGGTANAGVVFSFEPLAESYSVLHEFSGGEGNTPFGDLVYDSSTGLLYGMTSAGGANAVGVIFSVSPETTEYVTLHDFVDTTGKIPFGSLTLINGVLYGMTNSGGVSDAGVIFSFDLDTNTYTVLYEFTEISDPNGISPLGSLISVGGVLYGMTSAGGTNNAGVIFSFNPQTQVYTKVFDGFSSINGREPHGSLISVDGVLYGMTSAGGANDAGVIFSFNPQTQAYTLLHEFATEEGTNPFGSLLYQNSVLYGMTSQNGPKNGSSFSYDLQTNVFSVLRDSASFSVTGDIQVQGTPVLSTVNNKIYGMTQYGGTNDMGVIFTLHDRTPDSISFDTVTNVLQGDNISSNTVTISGIDTKVPVQFVGGDGCADCYFRISGGEWQRVPAMIDVHESITLLIPAPGEVCQSRTAYIRIGDTTTSFTIETTCGGGGGGGDSTPPALTTIVPVPSPTADTTPSFTFGSDEAGTITYSGSCQSSTSSASVGEQTITFNLLSDGTHGDCGITVTDSSNNASTLSVNSFVVDATAPTVSFTMPSSGTSLTTTVTFSATDATTSVVGYKLTQSSTAPLVGDSWSATAPTQYTFSSYGTHTLYAWAKDAVGNISSGSSRTISLTEPVNNNDTNQDTPSHGGGGTHSGSSTQSSTQTSASTPQTEAPSLDQNREPSLPQPKKEGLFSRLPSFSTVVENSLHSPIKKRIQTNFTPSQVEAIETTIRAIVAGVTTFGGAIALASVLFLNPLASPEFILIPIRLWALLLVALGIRRKPHPWGMVYDAITKQPVDPVRVSLVDINGTEVASSITDNTGRYGFSVEPGIYKVILKKTNYIFPSHLVSENNMRDEFYDKPYFGDYIQFDPRVPIVKNIPIDPIDFNWEEFRKNKNSLLKYYSRREFVVNRILNTIFLTTFLLIIASLVVYPEKYNAIIFVLYIATFFLRKQNAIRKEMGRVYDMKGAPLGRVMVNAYSAQDHTLIDCAMTNRQGRYHLKVPNGTYYIRIERTGIDGVVTPIFASQNMEITHGVINKAFNVAYS